MIRFLQLCSVFLCLSFAAMFSVAAGPNDTINNIHTDISNDLTSTIDFFDRAFGERGQHEDDSELIISYVDQIADSKYQDKVSDVSKVRFHVRLDGLHRWLSHFNRKIELVVEADNNAASKDPSKVERHRSDNASSHIRIFSKHKGIKYDVGHHGLDTVFVAVEWDKRHAWGMGTFNFDSSMSYDSDDIFSMYLNPSYHWMISKVWLTEVYASFDYDSESKDWQWDTGLKFRKSLNKTAFISYGIAVSGSDFHQDDTEQYIFDIRYHDQLVYPWAYYEVQPFVRWTDANDFKTDPGIMVNIGAYFGK